MSQWISVEDRLPEAGKPVLMFTACGQLEGHWQEKVADNIDDMGCDAGFVSVDGCHTFPGRHFGNPVHFADAFNAPTHWMPLAEPPT